MNGEMMAVCDCDDSACGKCIDEDEDFVSLSIASLDVFVLVTHTHTHTTETLCVTESQVGNKVETNKFQS